MGMRLLYGSCLKQAKPTSIRRIKGAGHRSRGPLGMGMRLLYGCYILMPAMFPPLRHRLEMVLQNG
jgi:hypothetical protein